MGGMVHPLAEELGDMAVIQRVIDEPAFTARTDEAELSHEAQMMGDCGFACAGGGGEIADAEFSFDQGSHDSKPSRVAERGKKLSKLRQGFTGWHRASCIANGIDMNDPVVTGEVVVQLQLIVLSWTGHSLALLPELRRRLMYE